MSSVSFDVNVSIFVIDCGRFSLLGFCGIQFLSLNLRNTEIRTLLLKQLTQYTCLTYIKLPSPTATEIQINNGGHNIGQGLPRVIIYINVEELKSEMLHTKFQGNPPCDSGVEDFKLSNHIWTRRST